MGAKLAEIVPIPLEHCSSKLYMQRIGGAIRLAPTGSQHGSSPPRRRLFVIQSPGLKLQSRKEKIEMLIIDHAERPSKN
jgi:uncharacterized protein (TIGR03435 family)